MSLSTLLLASLVGPIHSGHVLAEDKTTTTITKSEHEDHEDHEDHDHDHEHEAEFDAEKVVKKDGDHYIMAHGDHYHTIEADTLTDEQKAAADKHLEEHPEVTEEYEAKKDIYAGYFKDEQVKDRSLSEYAGDWQSVYPFLQDGTLDMVMDKKAATGDMTAEEYKAYYEIGYATDVDHITITDDSMTFTRGDQAVSGKYEYAGFKILEYKKGNRGVRYLFNKVSGDKEAPQSVQFSDHGIAPNDNVTHYHIYFANVSQEELLEEMEHWPTYYPAEWNGGEILADQLNH